MDDLIIILLTLLFTIVAAVNRKNKKQPAPPGPGKRPESLKEILKEILDEPSPGGPVVAESPAGRKDFTVTPLIVPQKEILRGFSDEGARNEIVSEMIAQKTGDAQESFEPEADFEDFSLRKAVIYSEILRPRYFQGEI